jgi:hypothetical protein
MDFVILAQFCVRQTLSTVIRYILDASKGVALFASLRLILKSHILHYNQFNLVVGGLERYHLFISDYLQKLVR